MKPTPFHAKRRRVLKHALYGGSTTKDTITLLVMSGLSISLKETTAVGIVN